MFLYQKLHKILVAISDDRIFSKLNKTKITLWRCLKVLEILVPYIRGSWPISAGFSFFLWHHFRKFSVKFLCDSIFSNIYYSKMDSAILLHSIWIRTHVNLMRFRREMNTEMCPKVFTLHLKKALIKDWEIFSTIYFLLYSFKVMTF